jgi:signal transduction histidine kinase
MPSTARPRWPPFIVTAPTLVVVVGLLAALGISALGSNELKTQAESAAALRVELLTKVLAARLTAIPSEDHLPLLERAALRSGAEIVLVSEDGLVIADATRGVGTRGQILKLLAQGRGETTTRLGRARYEVVRLKRPFSDRLLVAFVEAPDTPYAARSLIGSVAALTLLLVGAAALAAFALARDVDSDVRFVRERIVAMAKEREDPAGEYIPVRSVDQVGVLTSAFNVLVDRFAAAERVYRQDLSGALAYDRDRSAFLAALSHELRTPLNAILGFTEVLLSEVDGPLAPDARENLNVVRGSGEHLRELIDDILDLSALESGELRLSLAEVDVHRIAQEVVRETQVQAHAKGLSLVLLGLPARGYADARRVRQMVSNLVSNAVKYTEHGEVVVRVEERDLTARISVTDTGPGIPPEQQESVFKEYWQAPDARTRRAGTGLGLAITLRLVKMHRGSIELTSEIGRGSTFTITLPSEPPPESKRRPQRKRVPARAQEPKPA